MSFVAMWMKLDIIMLSEACQRQIPYITYIWCLKNYTNEIIYQKKADSETQKQIYVCRRGKVVGRNKLAIWH